MIYYNLKLIRDYSYNLRMPLSRHFYSVDEVEASLLHSISRGRVEESLFWCQELIDSGYIGETISILFQSWLWNFGPFYIQWFLNAFKLLSSEELSETDILTTTYQLASIPQRFRDNSLWSILISCSDNQQIPDRLVRKYPKKWNSNNIIETHFIGAIYQGKSRNAWWVSRFIAPKRIWELLEWFAENVSIDYTKEYKEYIGFLQKYNELLGFECKEYDIIIRCLAICGFCIKGLQLKESMDKKWIKEIDPHIKQDIDIWSKLLGKKSRRIYKIQTSYLYGSTIRGNMKWSQNNISQLNDIEKYLIGCPFWNEAISDYGSINEDTNTVIWNSDEAVEEFYDKYFPDDIPDEWSKEEKIKSHGDGILGPNDITNIWKYSYNYLNGKTKLGWGLNHRALKMLEIHKDIFDDCNLHNYIGKVYQSLCENISEFLIISNENLKKLEPVCKIKKVSS